MHVIRTFPTRTESFCCCWYEMDIYIREYVDRTGCGYWRFNVTESNFSHERRGLDTVKYHMRKKERPNRPGYDEIDSFRDAVPEDRKGGYKPHKYRYRTYEKIRSGR